MPDMSDSFEACRPLMFSIAYRMLGSAMEAEDVIQETYLRYRGMPVETIQSHEALLSTIVTRLCINHLNSAHTRRESYPGPWLPEPILTGEDNGLLSSPANYVNTLDSLSMAFLILLENLTPVERAVFLLREVFDYDYAEIADIVGKGEAACRQLFSRAQKHIAEHRPRFKTAPEQHRQMLDSFMQVVNAGELEGLLNLLTEDVTLWADSGGRVRGAVAYPLQGREAVARFVLFSIRYLPTETRVEWAEVNGEMAIIIRDQNRALLVIAIDAEADRIRAIRVLANPDKLARL
jgi:RNA polymerase sigma-70 factor (ECF subfamily)